MNAGSKGNCLPLAKRRLVWVYGDSLATKLDVATWLETSIQLCRLGWQVTLVAAGGGEPRWMEGVEVVQIPKPKSYLLSQALFHFRLMGLLIPRWGETDAILFHQMSAPWLLPLKLASGVASGQRPLLVMDTRTLSMLPRDRMGIKGSLRKSFYGLAEWMCDRWGDGRLAITPRMAEVLGIPPGKLWGVWPSGVKLEDFASATSSRRWPRLGEPVQLIYVGVLHHERNLISLCRAVEEINAGVPRFTLSMVGNGTAREELAAYAGTTEGRIRVVPPVPREQVPALLAEAHVGVLPFPDEEGFRVSSPIKLFEYMGAGLPVLATRIPCHTDVIGDGKYVFWAEGADQASLVDSLRRVWESRSAMSDMGPEAAVAAEAWTWRQSAAKLAAALEAGLSRHWQPPFQEALAGEVSGCAAVGEPLVEVDR